MGRRRKLRGTQTAARVTDPELLIHDRRSVDLLANSRVDAVEVDDPYGTEPGAKIVAFRSTRDDPLAWQRSRNKIDEAQYLGGRAYQADFERAERGPGAIDPTKEAVDGGKMPDPITEGQRKAILKLNRVNLALGIDGSSLTMDFLIHRQTFAGIAAKRGLKGERWNDFFGRRIWECLNTLAVEYGYAHARSKPQDVENTA
jgi:hypothetical protein